MATVAPPVSFDNTAVAFSTRTDAELYKMYALFTAMNSTTLVKTGERFLHFAQRLHLPVRFVLKPTIFDHFCGGECLSDVDKTIRELAANNTGTILDYSVEGAGTEQSFDATRDEILRTIGKAKDHPHLPFAVFKTTGLVPVSLLEKVQQGKELSADERAAFERGRDRVNDLCRHAHSSNVRILIDAEESWLQDTIDNLAYAMMERYNQQKVIVYNTYQFYRHDRLQVLQRDYENALSGNYHLGVKLVRGAYMEKERERAQEKGYPSPINSTKAETDQLFDAALRFCTEHLDHIALCSGSHNEQSNYLLLQLMEKHKIAPADERVYFAQLYGMSDNLSFNLARAGYHVAKYVPYGPVEKVIPYLIRRAEENTAIAGQSSRELTLIKKEIERRKQAKG
ncbi:proline dehydrogenase family protein [Botryobacter ruber]|uniref:proline dehydrogenase family protein n=1 Tax=Botryobacter ruber TaxID=2171629 RepID=UPI000E0C50B6|nr:proline dehydrogenase family protein [Botryobacter ruber]